MRKLLVPLTLAAAVGFSGVAFAATSAQGMIKSIDSKAETITLSDGHTYQLPKGFKLDSFKVGEKVSVLWEMKGGKYEASEVKAAS
jgi:Cu/Ag efflux protein CusF